MTVQISDIFVDRGETFDLIEVRGERSILFQPEDIEIPPARGCISCCWNGYVATYTTKDDRLYLSNLNLALSDIEESVDRLSKIFNKSHEPRSKKDFDFWFRYKDIKYAIDFTGVVLIANNFLEKNFSYFGINHAYEYRDVIRLDFIDGQLLERQNISEDMAEFRDIIQGRSSKFRYNKYDFFLDSLH